MQLVETAGFIFLFTGLFFTFSGSLGLLRFKSFFARLHPAGVVDSLGAPMAITGLIMVEGFTLAALKMAILIVILLVTTPTACHALAKAAYGPEQRP